MQSKSDSPFKEFFQITRFDPDPGLLDFVNKLDHEEAESFLSYQRVVDGDNGLEIIEESVKPNAKVKLPKSARNRSHVTSSGTFPNFLRYDQFHNLETVAPKGCVIRVLYYGSGTDKKPKVKYFKTI